MAGCGSIARSGRRQTTMAVTSACLLSLLVYADASSTWTIGVLDDAAFPPEELSTLSSIVIPQLTAANWSAGSAELVNPEDGVGGNVTVGATLNDFTLVAVLRSPLTAVLERRFVRFGVIIFLQPGLASPARVLRNAVGTLETVQTQATTFYTDQYYRRFALERRDVLGDEALQRSGGEPTFGTVLPLLSPMANYLTLGSIGEGYKFTICPNGLIKLANGTLREPPAVGGSGIIVFDPVKDGEIPHARSYTDSVGGVLGDFLPAASFAFSDTRTGSAWEIQAYVKAYAQSSDPQPLIVRVSELGGVVRYYSAGPRITPTPLVPSSKHHDVNSALVAAETFYKGLLDLHGSFERFLLPPNAAAVAVPDTERRLTTMARAGLAQALATYDGLHQRYGTGIDYFVGTRELMTVATTVNSALLAWGAESTVASPVPGAAVARLQTYLSQYINVENGTFRFHTAHCGPNFLPDALSDYGELLTTLVAVIRSSGTELIMQSLLKPMVAIAERLSILPTGGCPGDACGLIFGPPEHDTCDSPGYYYHNNLWIARGLAELGTLLLEMAPDSQGERGINLLNRSRALCDATDASMRALRISAHGGKPAFIAPLANRTVEPFANMSDGMLASYSSFRYFAESLASGMLKSDLSDVLYEWKATQGGTVLGLTTIETDMWHTPNFSYPYVRHIDQYPAAFWARALFERDEVASFLLILRAHGAHACGRSTFGCVEQVAMVGNATRSLLPFDTDPAFANPGGLQERDIDLNLPATVLTAQMLMWMLVDAGGAPLIKRPILPSQVRPTQEMLSSEAPWLWIGRATPVSWLDATLVGSANHRTTGWSVQRVPTRYGRVSAVVSVTASGLIQVVVDLHRALPSNSNMTLAIRLRVPSPQRVPTVHSGDIQVAGGSLIGCRDNNTLVIEPTMQRLNVTVATLPIDAVGHLPDADPRLQEEPPKHRASSIDCDVRTYGAVGDGHSMDTASIEAALLDCSRKAHISKQPVRVIFSASSTHPRGPPSTIYLTGAHTLVDAVDLAIVIEPGVVVLGSTNASDYSTPCGATQFCLMNTTRILLTGGGVVDGNGRTGWYVQDKDGPMQLIAQGGSDLTIRGLTFKDSGSFHLNPRNVTRLRIEDVVVTSPTYSRNTDGIDPEDCDDVYIRNATVEVGDDGIALKGHTRNVIIEHVQIHRKMLAIGSSASVRNVTVRDSVIGWGLYIKSHTYKPTLSRDIVLENVRVFQRNTSATYAPCAIGVNMQYTTPPYNGRRCGKYPCIPTSALQRSGSEAGVEMQSVPAGNKTALGVANLTIRNLSSVEGAVMCVADMRGLSGHSVVRDVHFEDIQLRALVFGFGCNSGVDRVSYQQVNVATPQQPQPCGTERPVLSL